MAKMGITQEFAQIIDYKLIVTAHFTGQSKEMINTFIFLLATQVN